MLEELLLHRLDNLESIGGSSNSGVWNETTLPRLRMLDIEECPRLRGWTSYPNWIEYSPTKTGGIESFGKTVIWSYTLKIKYLIYENIIFIICKFIYLFWFLKLLSHRNGRTMVYKWKSFPIEITTLTNIFYTDRLTELKKVSQFLCNFSRKVGYIS